MAPQQQSSSQKKKNTEHQKNGEMHINSFQGLASKKETPPTKPRPLRFSSQMRKPDYWMYPKYSSCLHKWSLVWPSLLLLPTNMYIMYISTNHNFKKSKAHPQNNKQTKQINHKRLIHVVEFTCFLPPEHTHKKD